MKDFQEAYLPYTQLLLDPNNYRFQDRSDFQMADSNRFHEPSVQARAYERLKDDSLAQLKNSIIKNGFIPVERIVVRPYEHASNTYLVLEGNRRVAALRWIADDDAAGVPVPESVLSDLQNVPVLIVTPDDSDPAFYESLMGIRHVSGIKQWGGYERARLVAVMREKHSLDTPEIADRLGLSRHEVNRRFRAYTALEQMKQDEDYGDHADSRLYPIFHEAVAQPTVRKWLGWKDDTGEFGNEETVREFYDMLTPNDSEEGPKDPKISTKDQVRELKHILPNPEARRILGDNSRSFLDALAAARRDEMAAAWATEVAEAISALENIGVGELRRLRSEDIQVVERLRDVANRTLEDHKKLLG